MADYWKSNDRYFCELCNCWMADNKISRQLHEQGGRHKASVQSRINGINKSNREKEKVDKVFKETIDKMNHGAMESMFADVSRDPSLAKRYGIHVSAEAQRQLEERALANKTKKSSNNTSSTSSSKDDRRSLAHIRPTVGLISKAESHAEMVGAAYSLLTGDVGGSRAISAAVLQNAPPPTPPPPCSLWREAFTADGQCYYWNTVSNETRWTKPEEPVANRSIPPPFAYGSQTKLESAETAPSEVQLAKTKITFFHKQKLKDLQKKCEESSVHVESDTPSNDSLNAVTSYAESIKQAESSSLSVDQSVDQPVDHCDDKQLVAGGSSGIATEEIREKWRASALGQWQVVSEKPCSDADNASNTDNVTFVNKKSRNLQLPPEAWAALKNPSSEEGWIEYEEDVPKLCISEKKVISLKRSGDTSDNVTFCKRRAAGNVVNRSLRKRDCDT